ncbi:MAG: lipocalin-like domain-containing protein [Betaproteobacteria bacterium]
MLSARRRRLMMSLGAALLAPRAAAPSAGPSATASFAPVVPGYRMRFPHDEGSHPTFRLEWWYVTGWLTPETRQPLGFQVTFFRARPAMRQDNPSGFTPHHILIAHAALSDPGKGRLLHAQRMARAGFGLAGADEGRMRVWIDDWSLAARDGAYHAGLAWDEARFDLSLVPRQPALLQGEHGYSRKGPAPLSASYYYSIPHLTVSGTLGRNGQRSGVAGTAWLDHEWSSQYMEEQAIGWDWVGLNMDDGAALMLFRMRDRDGNAVWSGGTLRQAGGTVTTFSRSEIRFVPGRIWQSPRTGARYPVTWALVAGELQLTLEPLMDDQEHDTRGSTGTIYWEGAVSVLRQGRHAGRGYLELTGYWRPLNLSSRSTVPVAA